MAESRNLPANSVCGQCGREFFCGIADTQPCWCATEFAPLLSGAPDQGCLCPGCLRARIAALDTQAT